MKSASASFMQGARNGECSFIAHFSRVYTSAASLRKLLLIVNSTNPRIGKQILMIRDIPAKIIPLHADE